MHTHSLPGFNIASHILSHTFSHHSPSNTSLSPHFHSHLTHLPHHSRQHQHIQLFIFHTIPHGFTCSFFLHLPPQPAQHTFSHFQVFTQGAVGIAASGSHQSLSALLTNQHHQFCHFFHPTHQTNNFIPSNTHFHPIFFSIWWVLTSASHPIHHHLWQQFSQFTSIPSFSFGFKLIWASQFRGIHHFCQLQWGLSFTILGGRQFFKFPQFFSPHIFHNPSHWFKQGGAHSGGASHTTQAPPKFIFQQASPFLGGGPHSTNIFPIPFLHTFGAIFSNSRPTLQFGSFPSFFHSPRVPKHKASLPFPHFSLSILSPRLQNSFFGPHSRLKTISSF